MNHANDEAQRAAALDVTQSFIVQAPAGSGKTELLTQRFLKLLTSVDKDPEEILAITFTRKAANEMRHRILSAIQSAQQKKPNESHKIITWKLATQVIIRDQKENWQLLDNPNRLRIQTIDSLSAFLSKQLPITSKLGGGINIIEDARIDYQQAVDEVLTQLESNAPWAKAIATLLLHLDNNLNIVKELLVNMLSHREQWLPHIITTRNNETKRKHLQTGLHTLITDTLEQLLDIFPQQHHEELLLLLGHANTQLSNEIKSPFIDYSIAKEFPGNTVTDLIHWRAIATLLLTQNYTWRKSFDKRIGFPVNADTKEEKLRLRDFKERIIELTRLLSDNEILRQLLQETLLLPPAQYSTTQWEILDALLELLPIVAAQLQLTFQQRGHIDFIEIAQRALQALTDEDAPTDLALCLDYKIKHILIDEFQDTSATQFYLLQSLTRGWQNDDGRSLFLVGDPMQSIYRFRAAEVGLFLQAKQYGIGDIHLTPLTLSANFRSQAPIVDWFNQIFQQAFPEKDDITLGAISYTPSLAKQSSQLDQHLYFHLCDANQPYAEAYTIVNIIKNCQRVAATQSIALLVKTRRQLINILPILKKAELAFTAVEIENLHHLPAIQDLQALTLALQHFANRLAWLSILRTPWCGLSLQDLHQIALAGDDITIWQAINRQDVIITLSHDGRQRLQQFLQVMSSTLQQRGRFQLSQWVYGTWLALAGPATLDNESMLEDCRVFFELLEKLEHDENIDTVGYLEKALQRLYATSRQVNNLQVMTIHKAKGLEFDTVIMPSLETPTKPDKPRLLLLQERPTMNNRLDLLLAPIKARKDDADPIYDYIRHFEQRKNNYENMRLFYVGVTRAKRQLHLLTHFNDIENKPRGNNFLRAIWQHNRNDFKQYYPIDPADENNTNPNLKRLPKSFRLPDPMINMMHINPISQFSHETQANTPRWQETAHRNIGTVLHFILQQLSNSPMSAWLDLLNNNNQWEILLRQQNIPSSQLRSAAQTISSALIQMTQSKKARWIFDNKHDAIESEYAISYRHQNNIKQFIIDRTFITNNTRWIIDYKTSQMKNDETLESFLDIAKQRHQQQLENYADALSKLDDKPIKLGLYFPLLDAWIQWDY